MFVSIKYDLFSLKIVNELLGGYITCILMYNYMYMSVHVCYITFFIISLKPLHRFTSNFVSMFCGCTPTKIVKIRVLPFSWNNG